MKTGASINIGWIFVTSIIKTQNTIICEKKLILQITDTSAKMGIAKKHIKKILNITSNLEECKLKPQ